MRMRSGNRWWMGAQSNGDFSTRPPRSVSAGSLYCRKPGYKVTWGTSNVPALRGLVGSRRSSPRAVDDPTVEHAELAGRQLRQLPVVGHHDHRGAALGAGAHDEVEDALTRLGVDAPGGFVGEQQRRPVDEGAPHRDELPLAARQRRRQRAPPVLQADAGEHLLGTALSLAAAEPEADERQGDVLLCGEVGEEVVELEERCQAQRS